MPHEPLGKIKTKKKTSKGVSSPCTASGWVREGAAMNFVELPPGAASSQLWHHVLPPASTGMIPAPLLRPEGSVGPTSSQPEEKEKDANSHPPQHLPSPRGSATHAVSPREAASPGQETPRHGTKPSRSRLAVCFSSPTRSRSCLESLTAPRTHGKKPEAAAGERECCEEAAYGHEQMQGVRFPRIK